MALGSILQSNHQAVFYWNPNNSITFLNCLKQSLHKRLNQKLQNLKQPPQQDTAQEELQTPLSTTVTPHAKTCPLSCLGSPQNQQAPPLPASPKQLMQPHETSVYITYTTKATYAS